MAAGVTLTRYTPSHNNHTFRARTLRTVAPAASAAASATATTTLTMKYQDWYTGQASQVASPNSIATATASIASILPARSPLCHVPRRTSEVEGALTTCPP